MMPHVKKLYHQPCYLILPTNQLSRSQPVIYLFYCLVWLVTRVGHGVYRGLLEGLKKMAPVYASLLRARFPV